MKWILILSLILNGVLGWQLLRKKEIVREEVIEKVVVKKSAPEVIEKKVMVHVPGETNSEAVPPPHEFDEKEVEDSVVDVNKDKDDFLTGKLGFTEKEFKDIESVKQRFYDRYQKIIPPDQTGMLTLGQRKQIIALEEERDVEYARALGAKRWKEWESFRDNYNKKIFKKMAKERGVIVPMEI